MDSCGGEDGLGLRGSHLDDGELAVRALGRSNLEEQMAVGVLHHRNAGDSRECAKGALKMRAFHVHQIVVSSV